MASTELDEIDLNKEPPPLPKMTCTSTKCDENLHCFLPKKPRKRGPQPPQPLGQSIQLLLFDELPSLPGPGEGGRCRTCGKQLVDWARIHKQNLADASYTIAMLKLERWRQYYWCRQIDPWALNHARRRGRAAVRVEAEKMVTKRLAPANPQMKFRQTKLDGNIICYAQHATGTCCRKCLKYWHGIDNCQDLTKEQIAYVLGLIQLYINERLPDLPEGGVKVPPIRNKKSNPKE